VFELPAANPSAWSYEISLSFNAPSSATGTPNARPTKKNAVAVAVLAGGLPHLVFLVKHLLDRARETAQIL